MLVHCVEAYLLVSFMLAWVISYGLEDEVYGEALSLALRIDYRNPFSETVRIMLTAPIAVWCAV